MCALIGLCLFLFVGNSFGQDSAMATKIGAYLNPLIEMNAWSGAIGIYKDGAPIFENSYGLANREWNIKNSIHGRFRIASVSKVFTEVAVLKLVEDGKLKIDDPLSHFIADYPRGTEITIGHLINHTSGIPHLNSYPNYNELIKFDYSLNEIIDLFKNKKLDFNPGKKYSYSNSGYVLLAYIIERISQKSYGSYLKETILDPLKMTNTGVDDTSEILPNRVSGYMFDANAELTNADFVNMDIKIGGGSLYSSLVDLALFTNALVSEKLLTKTSLELLPNIVGNAREKIFSANGRVQGFCHQITHKYHDGVTVIVLGNHYSNIALPISDAVYTIFKGEEVAAPENYFSQKKDIHPDDLKKYVGIYDFGFGPIGEVEVRDNKLAYGNPNKTQRDVLIPIGDNRFFYPQSWVILEFEDLKGQEFKTLNWVMGENKYPAEKMSD
ncbi:MAG: serine hydrolase domain-containing protein [Bacteroidota bacterium]